MHLGQGCILSSNMAHLGHKQAKKIRKALKQHLGVKLKWAKTRENFKELYVQAKNAVRRGEQTVD